MSFPVQNGAQVAEAGSIFLHRTGILVCLWVTLKKRHCEQPLRKGLRKRLGDRSSAVEAQTTILESSTVSLAAIASRRILKPHRDSSREFCLIAVQLTQERGMRGRANLRALTLCVPEKVSRSRMHHRPLPRVCPKEALRRGCSQADSEDLGVCCTRARWFTRCVTLCLWKMFRAGGTCVLRAQEV